MKIIALEEHFSTPLNNATRPTGAGASMINSPHHKADALRHHGLDTGAELMDVGESRLAHMDAAGIDMQVLSLGGPVAGLTKDVDTAMAVARDANDVLYKTVRAHPTRFAGFAALPMVAPLDAAKELERAVKEYGFCGAMIRAHTEGAFIDEKEWWPLWEKAAALDVPVYLHPQDSPKPVAEIYYRGVPELHRAPWGYSFDCGLHFLRMIYAGVFDAYPSLKIILGHLGEGIPFFLDRLNQHSFIEAERRGLKKSPRQYVLDNLAVTSSGNFSTASFLCTMMELGIDNVMFSVDWPFESNLVAVDYLKHLPISDQDREKFAFGNAARLLRL